jgi:hypothetical protein
MYLRRRGVHREIIQALVVFHVYSYDGTQLELGNQMSSSQLVPGLISQAYRVSMVESWAGLRPRHFNGGHQSYRRAAP